MSETTTTNEEYQPLPEVKDLIERLKLIVKGMEVDINDTIYEAIKILEQGEAFDPEPHPDSGQGKWKEMAAAFSRNEEFYHGIVQQVGEILGKEAYTSDDGSVQDSVLALKVPELVKALKDERDHKAQYNG